MPKVTLLSCQFLSLQYWWLWILFKSFLIYVRIQHSKIKLKLKINCVIRIWRYYLLQVLSIRIWWHLPSAATFHLNGGQWCYMKWTLFYPDLPFRIWRHFMQQCKQSPLNMLTLFWHTYLILSWLAELLLWPHLWSLAQPPRKNRQNRQKPS